MRYGSRRQDRLLVLRRGLQNFIATAPHSQKRKAKKNRERQELHCKAPSSLLIGN
jgi:hypothetical protein